MKALNLLPAINTTRSPVQAVPFTRSHKDVALIYRVVCCMLYSSKRCSSA